MTVLTVLLSVAAALLLLGLLPLGLRCVFGKRNSGLWVRVGPLRLRVGKSGEKTADRKDKREKQKEEKKEKKEKPGRKKKKLSPPDFWEALDLLHTLLEVLSACGSRVCHRLCIDPLELTLVFDGARDPAGTAACYGAAQTAMWSLMPRAEELFQIPDPSLHLRVDFNAEELRAEGEIGFSLRLCDLLAAGFTALLPLLRWYLQFRKAHSGDIPEDEEESETAEDRKSDDKIA